MPVPDGASDSSSAAGQPLARVPASDASWREASEASTLLTIGWSTVGDCRPACCHSGEQGRQEGLVHQRDWKCGSRSRAVARGEHRGVLQACSIEPHQTFNARLHSCHVIRRRSSVTKVRAPGLAHRRCRALAPWIMANCGTGLLLPELPGRPPSAVPLPLKRPKASTNCIYTMLPPSIPVGSAVASVRDRWNPCD